jgi:hypothetical protein
MKLVCCTLADMDSRGSKINRTHFCDGGLNVRLLPDPQRAVHHRQGEQTCPVLSQKQYKTIENKSYFGILVSVNKTRSTQ